MTYDIETLTDEDVNTVTGGNGLIAVIVGVVSAVTGVAALGYAAGKDAAARDNTLDMSCPIRK